MKQIYILDPSKFQQVIDPICCNRPMRNAIRSPRLRGHKVTKNWICDKCGGETQDIKHIEE